MIFCQLHLLLGRDTPFVDIRHRLGKDTIARVNADGLKALPISSATPRDSYWNATSAGGQSNRHRRAVRLSGAAMEH